MNASQSFDQAVEFYDKTRPLSDAGVDAGIQALLDATGKGARILEVGTGTGRISIPMLERGADLIGCDLSAKMLSRQREKHPTARLAQADAAYLPFPSAHFDAVLTVHVMHLIGPWREALREFKRILRSGGVFITVSTNDPVGNSVGGEMRKHWRDWLTERGIDTRRPGAQNHDELRRELESLGAHWKEVEVVRFPHRYNLREVLDRFAGRIGSETWSVPEAIYQESLSELRDWTMLHFGDVDREFEDTHRFVLDVVSFDA